MKCKDRIIIQYGRKLFATMSKSRLAVLPTRTLGSSVKYNITRRLIRSASTIPLNTIEQIQEHHNRYIAVEDNTRPIRVIYSCQEIDFASRPLGKTAVLLHQTSWQSHTLPCAHGNSSATHYSLVNRWSCKYLYSFNGYAMRRPTFFSIFAGGLELSNEVSIL